MKFFYFRVNACFSLDLHDFSVYLHHCSCIYTSLCRHIWISPSEVKHLVYCVMVDYLWLEKSPSEIVFLLQEEGVLLLDGEWLLVVIVHFVPYLLPVMKGLVTREDFGAA